jgi:hypothetical protein
MYLIKTVLVFLAMFVWEPNGLHKISVKLTVEGNEENIVNRIKSKISTQLRGLSNTEVSDTDDALFRISINATAMTISSNNTAIIMSTILTQKVTCGRETFFKILNSVTNIQDQNDFESKCVDLVARFDTNFFEQAR